MSHTTHVVNVGELGNARDPGSPGDQGTRGTLRTLGIGIGWRPEIAEAVEALPGIDWVEAVAGTSNDALNVPSPGFTGARRGHYP